MWQSAASRREKALRTRPLGQDTLAHLLLDRVLRRPEIRIVTQAGCELVDGLNLRRVRRYCFGDAVGETESISWRPPHLSPSATPHRLSTPPISPSHA